MNPDQLRPLHGEGRPSVDRLLPDVFAAAVTSTRMAMVVSDPTLPDCPVVFCNQAFLDLTGYTEAEVIGRNCRFLQGRDTDPNTIRRIGEGLLSQQDVHEEILNYRKDGSHFWNALQVNPVVDGDNRLRYLFASQQDVTRHREAVFRQQQRTESLGALASGIAHQVSNLLTVVVGSVERARARSSDERQAEQLKRADWAARRTGELANALLAMTRRQAEAESPTDLNQALSELEGSFTHVAPERVEVAFDLAPTPVVARVDPVQLDLVVLNLIRNACDAMADGGKIVIRTTLLPPRDATELLGTHGAVELNVSDEGSGMPPDVAARATEAFFTTKDRTKGASGLGLFVAVSFAEQAGGRLLLDTREDSGTKVRIILPRVGSG